MVLGVTDRALGQSWSMTNRALPVSCYSAQDSQWHDIICLAAIYNGELWLTNVDEISTGSLDVAMRQVKKITIASLGLTIPSIYC